MLLGWGLRGYIGGGPYGALIPGDVCCSRDLSAAGLQNEDSAMAALSGVIGVGYGGNMTYGQTLGFLRGPETTPTGASSVVW